MKNILGILAVGLVLTVGAGQAFADSAHFALEPTDSGKTWQGVNAPGDGAGDHYGRNIFRNFTTDTNPTNYYGVIDNGPDGAAVKAFDSVTVGGSTLPAVSGGRFGIGDNTNGAATFNVGNLNLTPNNNFPKYFWVEMDTALEKATSYIKLTLSGTNGSVVQSGFWTNGVAVTGLTGTENTYTWERHTLSSDHNRINAWFKFDTFPSLETLKIDFVTKGHNSYAYIDNLHIATTPEPVASALFGVGGAILAFRRRMQKKAGLQLA